MIILSEMLQTAVKNCIETVDTGEVVTFSKFVLLTNYNCVYVDIKDFNERSF